MVSISTRRLPSTWIEDTVWAAAADGTSKTAKMAAGMANMIRAASKPPRTRIPKFMRKAPLSFQCRSAPLRTSRFPLIALLVANFAGAANVRLGGNFNFIPKRCPSVTPPNKASRTGQMQDIVIGGKHHQHQHQTQSDPKPHLLRPVRYRAPAHGLDRVEQKVTVIKQRDRKQGQ